MSLVKREETSKSLNMRMKLPDTRAAIQCIEEEFVESKGTPGNFHIHRTWQIIDHADVKIDGQEIDLTGRDIEKYTTTVWTDGRGGKLSTDDKKVKKGLGRAYDEYDKLGIVLPAEGLDTENPPLEARGKVVDCMLISKEEQQTERPTPEQIARGQKVGDKKVDENGKPVMIFKLDIAYILGLSKVEPQAF